MTKYAVGVDIGGDDSKDWIIRYKWHFDRHMGNHNEYGK